MKNNKGYYSWIHSMKNAAMEAHKLGQKMIAESKTNQLNEALTPEQQATLQQIRKEKEARGETRNLSRLQGQDPDSGKVDLKPVGDAQDVEDDGEDHVIGNNAIDPSLVRRTSKIARQARAEAGTTTAEDIEDERLEVAAEKYEQDKEDEQENIEGIIDRMMRGKR